MLYKLVGFSQNGPIRRFSFQQVGQNATPETFAVSADIIVARDFGISLQELPSLCSSLLQRSGEDQPAIAMRLTEADMTMRAAEHAAATQKDNKRRNRFKPNLAVDGGSQQDTPRLNELREASSNYLLDSGDASPIKD